MIKVSRYDLMNLVIAIANNNILANNVDEMIESNGVLNQQVGLMLQYLNCDTIEGVKVELTKFKK